MTSLSTGPRSLALCAVLGVWLTALGASSAGAQVVVRVGRGSTSLQIPVQFTIPTRIHLLSAGAPRVVEREPGFVEVELPVVVAANVAWSLRVQAPERDPLSFQVRDENGEWVALTSQNSPRVLQRRPPTEPAEFRIRVRLPSSGAPDAAARLRLLLEPADG